MTKPMCRNVIGPRTATWSVVKLPPTAAIWTSHQMFQAWSDRIGKISFW